MYLMLIMNGFDVVISDFRGFQLFTGDVVIASKTPPPLEALSWQ